MNSERWEGWEVAFRQKQHAAVLLSPSGKGSSKQNPRHLLMSMKKN